MKIGIVTPAIDSSIYIGEAIASVRRDQGAETEHVIVHDGSDSFADQIMECYPWVRIIPGKGQGACAAAILGFQSVDADFLIQLNSDDRLGPDCIGRLLACAEDRPDVRIWTGGTELFRHLPSGEEQLVRRINKRDETAFNLANLLDDLPSYTARFCHRSMYETIGGLDMKYVHCNDRELMVRAFMAGITEAPLDCITSQMRMHDDSVTLGGGKNAVPAFFACHLALADYWLNYDEVPAAVRRIFKVWRAREILRLASCESRVCGPRAALQTLFREIKRCPSWPFLAVTALGARRRRHRGVVP